MAANGDTFGLEQSKCRSSLLERVSSCSGWQKNGAFGPKCDASVISSTNLHSAYILERGQSPAP